MKFNTVLKTVFRNSEIENKNQDSQQLVIIHKQRWRHVERLAKAHKKAPPKNTAEYKIDCKFV